VAEHDSADRIDETGVPRDVALRATSRAPHQPRRAVLSPQAGVVPTPRGGFDHRPTGTDEPTADPSSTRRFPRLVGVVIFGLAAGSAALLLLAASAAGPSVDLAPTHGFFFGIWHVLYATEAPTPRVAVGAVALAALATAVVVLLELRISNQSRRSTDADANPLAPKIVMARTLGVFAGPVTVTVLIPAHNEEASLPHTIASLVSQSHPPERIVVVADNCSDSTVAVARRTGVEVIESVGNTHKKAGALNQVLRQVLPGQSDNDAVMIMDADTCLDDGFLEAAVERLTADRALMAIGGLFYGEEGAGLLGLFQRNEYSRYSRDIRRRRGRVFVLTGTASLFRPAALRAVARCRGTSIPGAPGDVYDTAALTEDNELTIALKSLGALMISPGQCTVVTEVMPTWRALWNQRLRWQRGALENLAAYGMTPRTFRYWAQQLGIGYGVIALASYFLLIVLTVSSMDTWVWFPFWMGLGLLFAVERVVTVWDGGVRARLLGAALLPELIYATFLDVVYVKGVTDILLGRQAGWKHVTHASADAPSVETAAQR
jgi:cellulose synthase/poly-beta-1,6-N-acetylglucosamine synthase-like glycosyltransferase